LLFQRNSDAISQNIKQMEERKALKIQKEKLEQQNREMAQCTFTPSVNHKPLVPSNTQEPPVTVRGLDRFVPSLSPSTPIFLTNIVSFNVE